MKKHLLASLLLPLALMVPISCSSPQKHHQPRPIPKRIERPLKAAGKTTMKYLGLVPHALYRLNKKTMKDLGKKANTRLRMCVSDLMDDPTPNEERDRYLGEWAMANAEDSVLRTLEDHPQVKQWENDLEELLKRKVNNSFNVEGLSVYVDLVKPKKIGTPKLDKARFKLGARAITFKAEEDISYLFGNPKSKSISGVLKLKAGYNGDSSGHAGILIRSEDSTTFFGCYTQDDLAICGVRYTFGF